jgi:pilus assembly protein CpaB
MKPARIVLLLVALIAGGLAAFLVTRGDKPAPEVVTEVVAEQKARILVAKAPIGVGQRLTADIVEWQDWPEGAVRPEYITIATSPNAPTDVTGAVARFEIFPGEPIREQKLVRSDQGYLSAVLEQGMRGVSIDVTAASGAGGFIVPNDRVDVVLTRESDKVSETVLSNVKVLAIGKRLGQMGTTGTDEGADGSPTAQTFDGSTIATLELSPTQSETIVNSAALGALSLTLRSIVDFKPDAESAERVRKANQSIRLIRYGKQGSVSTGAAAQPEQATPAAPIVVNPVSYTPAPAMQAAPAAAPVATSSNTVEPPAQPDVTLQ